MTIHELLFLTVAILVAPHSSKNKALSWAGAISLVSLAIAVWGRFA